MKSLCVLLFAFFSLSAAIPAETVEQQPATAVTESLPTVAPSPEMQKKIASLNLMLNSTAAKSNPTAVTPAGDPDLGAIALRLATSLIVVLILIYGLYRLARRVRKMDLPPSEGGKSIQLLENYHIGTQQKVILMRVGENRVILVGVTQQSMSTLSVIEGAEAKTMLANANAALVTPAQFSETVSQMLSRFRKDESK